MLLNRILIRESLFLYWGSLNWFNPTYVWYSFNVLDSIRLVSVVIINIRTTSLETFNGYFPAHSLYVSWYSLLLHYLNCMVSISFGEFDLIHSPIYLYPITSQNLFAAVDHECYFDYLFSYSVLFVFPNFNCHSFCLSTPSLHPNFSLFICHLY